jgi:uncharacterized protein (DUF302 family)
MSAETSVTSFAGSLVTIYSDKSFAEVTTAIEERIQRVSVEKLNELVQQTEQAEFEKYMSEASTPTGFSVFWEFEQGSAMRMAGIPIESKFYLLGNAVTARGLFRYSAASGLGAPVRVCVSQHDGERTRIDLDLPSAFFSKFPETEASEVPRLLDARMVKILEEAAA